MDPGRHYKSAGQLRVGMVGGGRGALIGVVHRMVLELDNEMVLVAGALSSNAEIARAFPCECCRGCPPNRCRAAAASPSRRHRRSGLPHR